MVDDRKHICIIITCKTCTKLEHIFFPVGNAMLCGRLCYELLRCCNSKLSSIRQESCALLYLLMRSNFEFTSRKGLTRVHLQVQYSCLEHNSELNLFNAMYLYNNNYYNYYLTELYKL